MGEVAFIENGIAYKEVDGIYYPMLELEAPKKPIGKYGSMRRQFLMENREGTYIGMVLTETLNQHLEEVDEQAFQMMDRLMGQMAEREGVTEKLKAQDQMKWVGMMNNIRNRAEEIVLAELVYV